MREEKREEERGEKRREEKRREQKKESKGSERAHSEARNSRRLLLCIVTSRAAPDGLSVLSSGCCGRPRQVRPAAAAGLSGQEVVSLGGIGRRRGRRRPFS